MCNTIPTSSKVTCEEQKKPVIFSFFSGSGFLDLGFENSDYNIVFVNEISQTFLRAYKYSRSKMSISDPKFGYHNLDISVFLDDRKSELQKYVNDTKEEGHLVGFIGGPPCPDFSIAGKNKGAEGENGKLSLAYINLISAISPDFFLFENVKGLWSTAKHKLFYEKLKTSLHKAGYSTAERLCNALEFGVPQDRERILTIGVKDEILTSEMTIDGELINFPWTKFTSYNVEEVKNMKWSSTDNFGENPALTLNDSMKTLTVQYWFEKNDVDNHPNSKAHFIPRKGIEKMRTVAEGDVSRKSYKRLHRYRYSPTAAYGNNEVHLHPYKVRRISASEALAIQSLPKEFELPSDMNLSDMFKTIGNGVPFLFSKAIADSLNDYLKIATCTK